MVQKGLNIIQVEQNIIQKGLNIIQIEQNIIQNGLNIIQIEQNIIQNITILSQVYQIIKVQNQLHLIFQLSYHKPYHQDFLINFHLIN